VAPDTFPNQNPPNAKPYLFWLLLALPAVYIVAAGLMSDGRPHYLRNTGLVSCWMLIVTLAVTPLSMLFGPTTWIRWLRKARRNLGVASFAYACLHLAVFLKDTNPTALLRSFVRPEILTGWLGFFVMLAMALTSTDYAVRRMGTGWKKLQQLVYGGALLVLWHWVFTEKHYLEVAVYVAPLVLLTVWRLMRRRINA
jgi:methionine sulfoxide reductase heme-binding subunit